MYRTAPEPHAAMAVLDYVMVVAYLLLTAGIVWYTSRHQKDTDDFFFGGRRLPWFAVGLSIMATLLSTISYLGIPGEMIKYGVAILWIYLSYPLAMCVIIPLFIPFFMRLKLTSAYEYLERRFDYRIRVLASIKFFCLRLGWISMVMFAGSKAIASMTDSNLFLVIALMGIAATVYSCVGGLSAVVWTDVLQAVMLLGGAAVIVVYVWATTGAGPSDWWSVVSASKEYQAHTSPPTLSLDPTVTRSILWVVINGFFWQICTHASDQVVLQRYFSTTSLASARNSFIVNILSSLVIGVLLGLAGFALLFFYLQHPGYLGNGMKPSDDGDKIMPYFYAHQLPIGCGGLVLANFLCDAMQTLVSGVNSITAVASNDLIMKFTKKPRTERDQLKLARVLTLVLGLMTTCIALGIAWLSNQSGQNIISLMPKTFNMFLGPLASLFLIGMFVPRARGRTALIAGLTALSVSIFWSYFRQITGNNYDLSPFWAITVPCVVGVSTAFALSFMEDRDHPGAEYSWWRVMSRPGER